MHPKQKSDDCICFLAQCLSFQFDQNEKKKNNAVGGELVLVRQLTACSFSSTPTALLKL